MGTDFKFTLCFYTGVERPCMAHYGALVVSSKVVTGVIGQGVTREAIQVVGVKSDRSSRLNLLPCACYCFGA